MINRSTVLQATSASYRKQRQRIAEIDGEVNSDQQGQIPYGTDLPVNQRVEHYYN